jgi:hypothetical protein
MMPPWPLGLAHVVLASSLTGLPLRDLVSGLLAPVFDAVSRQHTPPRWRSCSQGRCDGLNPDLG